MLDRQVVWILYCKVCDLPMILDVLYMILDVLYMIFDVLYMILDY